MPSIESLTNDDDYDDNGGVEPRSVPSSSVAVGRGWRQDIAVDKALRLYPPSRTDVVMASGAPMTSSKDRQPEIEVGRNMKDRRSRSRHDDVTQVDFHASGSDAFVTTFGAPATSVKYRQPEVVNVAGNLKNRLSGNREDDVTQIELNETGDISIERQEITRRVVTSLRVGKPEVEITEAKSDCADVVAVSGRPMEEDMLMQLNVRSPRCRSALQLSWIGNEDCPAVPQLSTPRLSYQSNRTVFSVPAPGSTWHRPFVNS